jgi:hypothetical protein
VPCASGLVTTRGIVTVLQGRRRGPELCLGAVLDSLPPQCSGPPVVGWRWAEHPGAYRHVVGVRWGDFVLTGYFDGRRFTPTKVVPAAQATRGPAPLVPPAHAVDPVRMRRINRSLGHLPGVLVWGGNGLPAEINVTYDDGTLQAWCDRRFGRGTIDITSALVR